MTTVIFSIIIFGLLIGVHEAGHLIAAKSCNVLVHEFSLGMGPELFSFTKGETKYSLRLIPIGGFCKMEGEDEESDSARAFCNKHPLQKIIILCSGALMNILLGLIAVTIIFSGAENLPTTKIASFIPSATAQNQGLEVGDEIVKINNKRVIINQDIYFNLMLIDEDEVSVTVKRDGEHKTFNITTYNENGARYIGVINETVPNNIFSLLNYSFRYLIYIFKTVVATLGMLFTGALSFKNASGPVGIVTIISSASSGAINKDMIYNLLNILALITVNLGVFNLLPFPALDGGRVVFSLYEFIFRRKVSAKAEGLIHGIGLLILFGLMIFVTFNDVIRLFNF